MNLCTEEQNLSNVLPPEESAESTCSCTTQVLETNTERKRLLLLLCVKVEDTCLLLYIKSSQLYPLFDYFMDTAHSYDCAILLIHQLKQFIFLKKTKDVCMKEYGNKYIFVQ